MTELSKGLRRDAELIVGLCMSVEEGDTVTIITDNDHLTRPMRWRRSWSSAAASRW